MSNVFAFDIETVPDIAGARRLYGLDGLPDDEVLAAMQALRREASGGSEFQRHYLHRVVVISVAARIGERFRLFSLSEPESDEAEILRRFFEGIERYVPVLVSWNGGGFDLPVLHYRTLIHGISAARYWENGDVDREFRYNNYLNRFHERHTDLMDVLAGFQPRASAPLDDIATLCGLPGKQGMSGADVSAAVAAGEHEAVRDYCESDVLNTYLLYLRFELLRGRLDATAYAAECQRVRDVLAEDGRAHLTAFLEAWREA